MELFKEVRQVRICKHGNMTDYEPCPQCESTTRLTRWEGCDD